MVELENLNLGRKGSYVLNSRQLKKAENRYSRIENYIPNILRVDGIHDACKSSKK